MAEDEEQAAEKEEGVEYSIVVFHHLSEDPEEEQKQERLETTEDMEHALRKAEQLSYTGEYHKVEVKKKFKDKENDREIEMTLKLYEGALKKPTTVKHALVVALLCCILAFLVSFFGVKFMKLQKATAEREAMEVAKAAAAEAALHADPMEEEQKEDAPMEEKAQEPKEEDKYNPFTTLFE